MKKKYVFEAGSTIPIVLAGEYAEELSIYIDNDGNQAFILPGWVVSRAVAEDTIFGKNLGLVIYRIPMEEAPKVDWDNPEVVDKIKRTYDQLVWCPVNLLDSDGTLDGVTFDKKFGRRNFRKDEFSEEKFHEDFTEELRKQCESVEKYGGFYITRYSISEGKRGKPTSVKGIKPWVKVNYPTALEIASKIENTELVQSHLLYGAEYDSVLSWIIKSESKNYMEIIKDSTRFGNYWNSKISKHRLVITGKHEDWRVNNLYDFAGNNDEWTQEKCGENCRVLRGGDFYRDGNVYPAAIRSECYPNTKFNGTGLHASIFIK